MEHTHKDGVSTTTRTTDPSKSKLSDALLRKVGETKFIACIYHSYLPGNVYVYFKCNHYPILWNSTDTCFSNCSGKSKHVTSLVPRLLPIYIWEEPGYIVSCPDPTQLT